MGTKPRGGRRPGAGRPKGSKNTRTAEIARQAAAQGITPIDFMLSIMRDEAQPLPFRADMAKGAAPYIHPRLAAESISLPAGESYEDALRALMKAGS